MKRPLAEVGFVMLGIAVAISLDWIHLKPKYLALVAVLFPGVVALLTHVELRRLKREV